MISIKFLIKVLMISFLVQKFLYSQTGWFLMNSNTKNDVNSIHFINNNTGIAVGDNNLILKTSNGGENWYPIEFNLQLVNFMDVYMISSDTIVISGGNESIFKSIDAGKNWVIFYNLIGNNSPITKLHFINNKDGYAASIDYLYKTNDGGINWTYNLYSNTSYYLGSFHFIDEQNGWRTKQGYGIPPFGSNSKFIYKTSDGGLNWNLIYSLNNISFFFEMYFFNSQLGFLAEDNLGLRHILRTTDGGLIWNFVSVPSSNRFNKFYFINSLKGWVICQHGKIYSTIDGGEEWTSQISGVNSQLTKIFFINNYTGWITGDNGIIIKTTNGGGTTSVNNNEYTLPARFILHQNYPNPFNPKTIISYELRVMSEVRIAVFELTGREITTLVNKKQNAGEYKIVFDGSVLNSGVYFYKIEVYDEKTNLILTDSKRMVLTK